jgi:hypothetical protein
MGRLVWFGIGVGVAVFAAVKARQLTQQAGPKAIGQRVADSAVSVGERASEFTDRLRAAMAEREAELRAELNLPADRSDRLGLTD